MKRLHCLPSLRVIPLALILGILSPAAFATVTTAPIWFWGNSVQGDAHPYNSREEAAAAGVAYWCGLSGNVDYFTSCSYGGLRANNFAAVVTNIETYHNISVYYHYYCPAGSRGETNWWDEKGKFWDLACVDFSASPPDPKPGMQIIPASKPIIPGTSSVVLRKVLTHDDLTILVRKANAPVPGVSAAIQSDRSIDVVKQPATATDGNGAASASVETRDQTGISTIASGSSGIETVSPGTITWLPAHYQNNFLITCYVISSESDFVSTPLISNVAGLPAANKYRQGFINDVRMQGSGQAADGTVLHYDGNNRYSIQSCARTATGACAVDGSTIAVDPKVIPLRGSVAIDTVGDRAARDTGGAINGNHIDVYYGARRADCRAAGRRDLGVDFINY